MGATWFDFLDPTREELARALPGDVHPRALDQLVEPLRHDDEPRPTLEAHGDYVFGVFLVPVAVPEDDTVYYQEVDIILTRTTVITVRKTPDKGKAFDCKPVQELHGEGHVMEAGMVAYHLVDDIAEQY